MALPRGWSRRTRACSRRSARGASSTSAEGRTSLSRNSSGGLSIRASAVRLRATTTYVLSRGGSHEVPAADLRERHSRAVRSTLGRGEAGALRRVGRAQPDPGGDAGGRDGLPGDGHDRARAGRRDADHRRPLHRREGGARRHLRLRGRQPRRSDRARRAHTDGAARRRDRNPAAGAALIEHVFRDQWGRVLASLVGFLGDFDLAEEATQEAFATAAQRWPAEGTPDNPAAWLVKTARNHAIDRIRRERTLAAKTKLLDRTEA